MIAGHVRKKENFSIFLAAAAKIVNDVFGGEGCKITVWSYIANKEPGALAPRLAISNRGSVSP